MPLHSVSQSRAMATEGEPTPESLAALEARLTASAVKRERWVRVLLETKIDRLKQSQRSQLEQISGELEESRKRERELEGALAEARGRLAEEGVLRGQVSALGAELERRGEAACDTEEGHYSRVLAEAGASLPPEMMAHLKCRAELLAERVGELRAALADGKVPSRLKDRTQHARQREGMRGRLAQNQDELQRTRIIADLLLEMAASIQGWKVRCQSHGIRFERDLAQWKGYALHMEDREHAMQWSASQQQSRTGGGVAGGIGSGSVVSGGGGGGGGGGSGSGSRNGVGVGGDSAVAGAASTSNGAAPLLLSFDDISGRRMAPVAATGTQRPETGPGVVVGGSGGGGDNGGGNGGSYGGNGFTRPALTQSMSQSMSHGMSGTSGTQDRHSQLDASASGLLKPMFDLNRSVSTRLATASNDTLGSGGPLHWLARPGARAPTSSQKLPDAIRGLSVPAPPEPMYSVRVGKWSSHHQSTVWAGMGVFKAHDLGDMFNETHVSHPTPPAGGDDAHTKSSKLMWPASSQGPGQRLAVETKK